jgi:hypothetical protein
MTGGLGLTLLAALGAALVRLVLRRFRVNDREIDVVLRRGE